MEKFDNEFCLKLLEYLVITLPGTCWSPEFYWGRNESGYYWGDKSIDRDTGEQYLHLDNFFSLQDLVESVFKYIHLE